MTIDERLRRTLHAVAGVMPEAAPAKAPRRSRKRISLILAVLAVPLAASGYVLGSEHVNAIPPKNVLLTGDVRGERYWLVPSRIFDDCGSHASAVELVVEEWNSVGEEWNTAGIAYGDSITEWIGTPSSSPAPGGHGEVLSGMSRSCGLDESKWLADPSLFDSAHVKLGDDRIYMITVHPTVTAVKVQTPTSTETITTITTPARPDGPRFAAFDVPESSGTITVTLLDAAGDEVTSRDLAKPRTSKG